MNRLFPGMTSQVLLDAVTGLTSIRSEDIKEGLTWRLVKGHKLETAASLAGIKPSNLHRALENLDQVMDQIELINELQKNWRPEYGGPDNVEVTE